MAAAYQKGNRNLSLLKELLHIHNRQVVFIAKMNAADTSL
jgi:hypothetical protein